MKPTLKKVSKYENKFAKLQKKAAEFNFRNQLKQVKKKEFTLEEEDKEVRMIVFQSHSHISRKTWKLSFFFNLFCFYSAVSKISKCSRTFFGFFHKRRKKFCRNIKFHFSARYLIFIIHSNFLFFEFIYIHLIMRFCKLNFYWYIRAGGFCVLQWTLSFFDTRSHTTGAV